MDLLSQLDISGEVSSLLPQLITEMETLRGLTVDRTKTEKEQKKQAGFIQQRKRARLNELFKTLQRLGFSYRFGVTNCADINNYEEMYKHLDGGANHPWKKSEKYFFRTLSRYRHLLTLLDRAPPPDIGCSLHERFQGFVQHMLSVARNWRSLTVDLSSAVANLSLRAEQFQEEKQFDHSRDGAKYRALLYNVLDLMETLRTSLDRQSLEYSNLSDLRLAAYKCGQAHQRLRAKLTKKETVFAPGDSCQFLSSLSSSLTDVTNSLDTAIEKMKSHPVSDMLQEMSSKLRELREDIDKWCMQGPAVSNSEVGVDIQVKKVILYDFDYDNFFQGFGRQLSHQESSQCPERVQENAGNDIQ